MTAVASVAISAFLLWPMVAILREKRPDYRQLGLYAGALIFWLVIALVINYDYPCSVEECF